MKKLQRILCADDEPDMRMLIRLCLENVGNYDVLICNSGKELLENVERWKPDLIILDAVMPLISGPDTFRQLRLIEGAKDIPVIFMTGRALDAESEFMSMGAIGFITKPFDPLNLGAQIEALWNASFSSAAMNNTGANAPHVAKRPDTQDLPQR